MENLTFIIGVTGGAILVVGAAYPVKKVKVPVKSVKNWLFTVGWLFMLAYSIMNYLAGGAMLFLFLQFVVGASTVMMMLNLAEKYSVPILTVAALVLIGCSLYLFEGYNTLFFVTGLAGIAIGYVLKSGTLMRNLALTVGAVLIALFSYFVQDWIFFWLNVVFAIFSVYYVVKLGMKKKI